MALPTDDLKVQSDAFLAGGTEVGALMRAHDWSQTPLGPIETWSPALRMTVSFMLANRFPLLLWWGPQYISIYNDAYRPILGTKHPKAIGQPVSECWSETWHILQPLIDTPFHGGSATWMEDLRLDLDRHGFVEETHFTIAYSPVPDEAAPHGIGGVLATVHEITEKVVAERRIAALRDLGAPVAEARTAKESCAIAAEALSKHAQDVPFTLLYLMDSDGKRARLAGAAGVGVGEPASPTAVELADESADPSGWPLAQAVKSETMQVVEDLGSRFPAVPPGPWSDPPHTAVVVPIKSNIAHQFAGVLVAGVSSRLRLDDLYRSFFELVVTQIATAIANARAYEEERRRADALAEIDRAKTAFFSNVSHEFRTPLTPMLRPFEERLAGAFTDITERRRTEQLLSEQKRLLEMIALGAPLDDCLSSLCAAVPKLSPRARASILLADAERRMSPRSIAPDLLPSFGEGLKDAPINNLAIGTCGEAVFRAKPVTYPNIANNPKWSRQWRDLCVANGILACHSVPILDADGLPLGSFMLCFDEPRVPSEWERRLAEFGTHIASIALERDRSSRTLRESEQHLRTLSQSLERRVEARTAQLQRQAARLRRLAGELSSTEQRERKRLAAILHDGLQQLLVAAKMRLRQSCGQIHDPAVLAAIAGATDLLDQAVDSSRDLTRELRPPVLYEGGLLPALRWLASELPKLHELHVVIDAEDTEPPLSDEAKALLFEAVRELLFNVAKHAGVKEAAVGVRQDGQWLRIAVEDKGIGFDIEAAVREEDPQQLGLGLFSIRERLTALGGSIAIESIPGEGTRIGLAIPLAPVPGENTAARWFTPATARTKTLGAAAADCQTRILVVDDHAIVREGISNVLRGDKRLMVVGEAGDGVEAIEAVERHQPDVVLIDVNMPRMNGVEATREIRRRWPEVRIVALSVQDDAATARTMTRAGAVAFISKSDEASHMIDAVLAPGREKSN